jgi:hypothetical protein
VKRVVRKPARHSVWIRSYFHIQNSMIPSVIEPSTVPGLVNNINRPSLHLFTIIHSDHSLTSTTITVSMMIPSQLHLLITLQRGDRGFAVQLNQVIIILARQGFKESGRYWQRSARHPATVPFRLDEGFSPLRLY